MAVESSTPRSRRPDLAENLDESEGGRPGIVEIQVGRSRSRS